jgi:hypothetical protein
VELLCELVLENPHKTPLAGQLFVLDKNKFVSDFTTVETLQAHAKADESFGIGGGQHEFIARKRMHEEDAKLPYPHMQAEVYVLGAFKQLRALVDLSVAAQWDGPTLEKKCANAIPEWEGLPDELKEVAHNMTCKMVVQVLVSEHNEVPGLCNDLTLRQLLRHLRDVCWDHKTTTGSDKFDTLPESVKKSLTKWTGLTEKSLAVRCKPCFANEATYNKLIALVSTGRARTSKITKTTH